MLKDIHLTLMIGPGMPVPAPKGVVDAVRSVRVTSGTDKTGFQITFAVGKNSPLQTTMLPAGYFDPITTRVIIIVTVNGFPNVLMDGVVTQQEMSPNSDPGQSTLTITGEDLSVLMGVVEIKRPQFALDKTTVLYEVLAPYAVFGVTPIVLPSFFVDIKMPNDGWDTQIGTDLDLIRTMVDKCGGYVFYVEPGPLPGQSIAYFGPKIRIPVPQPALSINMDAETNVESLSFSLNGLAKKVMIVNIMDPVTRKVLIPVPIPDISIFQPPLGARPTPPAKIQFAENVDGKSVPEVLNQVVGDMLKGASNAITASGSLDVLRYGHVLRSRLLVGVRGAGLAYDGFYYVDSVTHDIQRGQYKQSFQLSRDGLISNTPAVPV
jgi:hypothetical protein